jgi:hypothetical protein
MLHPQTPAATTFFSRPPASARNDTRLPSACWRSISGTNSWSQSSALAGHLLIRLFQQATICSLKACGAPAVSEESARVSAPVRHRNGLSRLSGCLSVARWISVPALRTSASLSSRPSSTLAVRGVSASGFVDVRNDSAQHENPADALVLGRLFDDHRHARHLGARSPTPARAEPIRNSRDPAPQARARDGQCFARTPAWRGGSRRHLDWRAAAGAARQPATERASRRAHSGGR